MLNILIYFINNLSTNRVQNNENNNFCKIDYRLCKADEFRCDSGECIPIEYKCLKSGDERMGCADKSHLRNCSK